METLIAIIKIISWPIAVTIVGYNKFWAAAARAILAWSDLRPYFWPWCFARIPAPRGWLLAIGRLERRWIYSRLVPFVTRRLRDFEYFTAAP